ncbi:hypothetical protein [Sutterella wadsworthensis]|uniref:hypothetical protein n=1 Tax=Sutterella wadsworthensis TaxID=40545 RepID=UPI003AB93F9F
MQRLSRAVGQSEFLVAPVLMLVLSLLAAFIGVPELSLAYLPVFLPLFYRLGYDGMTATAVALLCFLRVWALPSALRFPAPSAWGSKLLK